MSSPGFVPKPASSNLQPTPPTGSDSMDRPASLPSPKMWLTMIPRLATDDCTSKVVADYLPHPMNFRGSEGSLGCKCRESSPLEHGVKLRNRLKFRIADNPTIWFIRAFLSTSSHGVL